MPYVVVPLRLASERVPQKILKPLNGQALCLRVLERIQQAIAKSQSADSWTLIAAVDSKETLDAILKHFSNENIKTILTDPALPSGTDRVHSAIKIFTDNKCSPDEIIVNIQGDMPCLSTKHTAEFLDWCLTEKPEFGSLAHDWPHDQSLDDMGHVKVILNSRDEAIYFSRFAIPYSRVKAPADSHELIPLYHVGMYVYQSATLEEFCSLKPSLLEKHEGLEQLRALANGQSIKMFRFKNTDASASFRGVDTPEDLVWAQLQF